MPDYPVDDINAMNVLDIAKYTLICDEFISFRDGRQLFEFLNQNYGVCIIYTFKWFYLCLIEHCRTVNKPSKVVIYLTLRSCWIYILKITQFPECFPSAHTCILHSQTNTERLTP